MKGLTVCLLVFIGLAFSLPQRERRFDGNQVFRFLPKNRDEIVKILDIAKQFRADIWKIPKYLNGTLDLHIEAEHVEKFVNDMNNIGAEFSVLIKNLQKLVDEEKVPTSHVKARATGSFSLSHYHSSAEISQYLDVVASKSGIASVFTAGHSVQGRPIKYLKISTGGTKKAILIDGGLHAREWITPAVTLYFIDQLTMNPSNNPEITRLVQKFDWYLLPQVNPDGYEFSRTNDRMWRKNRAASHSLLGTCLGTDLNRNFGFQWNPAVGGSTNQCEEIFAGNKAFSEPETRALGNLMLSLKGKAIAYLNLHSFGQMWLWPWGYTTRSVPTDVADLQRMASIATAAMYPVHHAQFRTGSDSADLYPAAGGADDYAKGAASIKYSYTVELRDKGKYGFILPPAYIVSSGEETLAAVLAFASEIAAFERL